MFGPVSSLTRAASIKRISLLSGAKAHIDFAAFAARLKSCPDTKHAQIARYAGFSATGEVVLFQSNGLFQGNGFIQGNKLIQSNGLFQITESFRHSLVSCF
jgi:hypothetical protein